MAGKQECLEHPNFTNLPVLTAEWAAASYSRMTLLQVLVQGLLVLEWGAPLQVATNIGIS